MYFANWIDELASCEAADVPLNRNTFEPLVNDLRSVGQVRIPGIATIDVTPGTNRLLLGGPDTAENIFGALRLLFEHRLEALSWQPGGGDSGAVMLSPFIKPGTVSTAPYNHYSVLRTLQNVFGLPHTGNAADPLVGSIGPEVFNDGPSAQSLSLLASTRQGGGLLTLDRSRGTTLRLVGDGVVVHARCRASRRRTCRGVATLALSRRRKGAPSLLGRRSYVQLADRPRDLTIYLSPRARRYLHAHRRASVRLTLASRTVRGKTASARRALTLTTRR